MVKDKPFGVGVVYDAIFGMSITRIPLEAFYGGIPEKRFNIEPVQYRKSGCQLAALARAVRPP